ncbi:hypothetical protein DFH06DRAFT_1376952 [Mycena polygramma]|nr:hypothetical protein DFH06DRAFT_1376952 [Mycena polygramma]
MHFSESVEFGIIPGIRLLSWRGLRASVRVKLLQGSIIHVQNAPTSDRKLTLQWVGYYRCLVCGRIEVEWSLGTVLTREWKARHPITGSNREPREVELNQAVQVRCAARKWAVLKLKPNERDVDVEHGNIEAKCRIDGGETIDFDVELARVQLTFHSAGLTLTGVALTFKVCDVKISLPNAEDALRGDADADWSTSDGDDGGWAPAAPAVTGWQLPHSSATLLVLLGPSTLPLTHAPGIVERSVRRIISVHAPAPNSLEPRADTRVGARAVEQALRARYCAVELAPWSDWDGEGSDTFKVQEKNITLLVDPAAAAYLRVGMGLGGVWVHLQRSDGGGAGDEREKERDADGAKAGGQGLWYVDKIMWVLPSYWIADSKVE